MKTLVVPGVMLLALLPPLAVAEEPQKPFQYSDEWTVVSAPPPAGPYRSVNLDPRVPGQGVVPPMVPPPMEEPAEQQTPESAIPGLTAIQEPETTTNEAEAALPELPAAAPAAGIVTAPVEAMRPVDDIKRMESPQSPAGDDERMAGPRPGYGYDVPGSAVTMPPYGFGQRAGPPPGYYSYGPPPVYGNSYPYPGAGFGAAQGYSPPQGQNDELEVPPPPVYYAPYGRRPYQGAGW